MSGLKVLIAGVCALVLAGCETLDKTVDAVDAAGISRIGAVAGLSDRMNHTHAGLNFSANGWQVRMVPEWDMPGIAEASLAAALEKTRKFSDVGIVDIGELNRLSFKKNKAGLLAAAKAQGFDTVALILPMWRVHGSALVPGYGVFHGETLGVVTAHCSYQQTVIYVFNVATGKQIAWDHGYSLWDGACGDSSIAFKPDVDSYTEEEMEAIKLEIAAAFDLEFERTVRQLGFGAARDRHAVGK